MLFKTMVPYTSRPVLIWPLPLDTFLQRESTEVTYIRRTETKYSDMHFIDNPCSSLCCIKTTKNTSITKRSCLLHLISMPIHCCDLLYFFSKIYKVCCLEPWSGYRVSNSPLTGHNPGLLLACLLDITPWGDICISWGYVMTPFVGNVVQRRKPQSTFCVSVRLWPHSGMDIWVPSFWTWRI